MKGIIVLDEVPKSCVDCPMCYHAEDMSLGQFKYERLYRCKLEPEEVEQVYLEDILHKKPDWCPIKAIPEKLNYKGAEAINGLTINEKSIQAIDEAVKLGWNSCIDAITGKK